MIFQLLELLFPRIRNLLQTPMVPLVMVWLPKIPTPIPNSRMGPDMISVASAKCWRVKETLTFMRIITAVLSLVVPGLPAWELLRGGNMLILPRFVGFALTLYTFTEKVPNMSIFQFSSDLKITLARITHAKNIILFV